MQGNNQYEELRDKAVDLAVKWAKTGFGYFSFEKAVNDFIEATGANRAVNNDPEAIMYGRRAAALRININSIMYLDKEQLNKLHDTLIRIAEDGVREQGQHLSR